MDKIKLAIEGDMLRAMRAVAGEFESCGKVCKIIFNATSDKKNLKLTDDVFECVCAGVENALNSHRYPNKSGHEFNSLLSLQSYLKKQFIEQRGKSESNT